MAGFERDIQSVLEHPVAMPADAHATGTVEHPGIDTNNARGVLIAYNVADVGGAGDIELQVQDSPTGILDSVGAAVFDGAGLDDATIGGTYTGTADATYEIEIDYVDADGRGADWVADAGNAGPDDLTAGGTYTGSTASQYEIEIDAEGTPDTFKWRKGAGAYTNGVAITGAAQTLAEGVQVTFGGTDNHTLADIWTLQVSPDSFKWRKDSGAYTSGVEITAGAQTLSDGVTVTFAAKLGHTLADIWTSAVVAETYEDVTGKTTGNIVAAEDGAISCFSETRRYVRIKSIISGNAVDAAATAIIYASRTAPNPL